ncbi:MAG: thioesterase family protein [bacterium]|nr:thioesterase family protein [bacterium]
MIESTLNFKVQYADTDAYKVAWHGSYLRWMEAGRVDLLYLNGVDIKELDEKEGIVMPVVDISIKYKQSARLLDDITVKTKVVEISNPYIIFEQTIENKEGLVYTSATVKGVAVQNGKIVRNLKKILKEE